ncbi:hypothetical protein JZ751_003285 [Albula glossodonta]|uniref:Cytohesin Ubiquitin Protein Inducing domain-containing protein n=1 Tax=Albula glossodonta TaxID=121402 RepID=A0A8T2N7W4_9TELE|nr:hypothetical protein JZ751_003285 [Albula glossodonta]
MEGGVIGGNALKASWASLQHPGDKPSVFCEPSPPRFLSLFCDGRTVSLPFLFLTSFPVSHFLSPHFTSCSQTCAGHIHVLRQTKEGQLLDGLGKTQNSAEPGLGALHQTSFRLRSGSSLRPTVSVRLAGSVSGRTPQESHDMEVKGPTITAMGLGAPDPPGCQDSKQRAERISELQERRRGLQTLLNARLGELRRVCLLEAELTGEIPKEFPLEAGERPPHVRRRSGLSHHGSKHSSKGEEEEVGQRKQKKALFSGALRRQTDSDQHPTHGKRTVHRGCHTEESSPSVATDGLSPSRPRLAPGSPDSRLCRKLSPVEIYYEMRTRRNSMASSASPSRSLPRSISNVEGRSVPATPLLSRTGPSSVHVRSDVSSGTAGKHWSDSPDAPQVIPLQSQEGSSSGSFERGGCPYSARTRRSNSSEALLDRTAFPEEAGPRTGMPSRGGPYKSSEALTDGRLRQVHRGSPERHLNGHAEQGRMRSSVGGRGGGGGGGYNEILMDYIWGKQQKMQVQQQQQQQQQQQRHQSGGGGNPRAWPEGSCSSGSPHFNGFPPSQAPHFAAGPPPYSPLLLRGKPGEPRRVKVTRTKSCGPFIPLQQHQQEALLLSTYSDPPHPTSSSANSSTAALYPYQTEGPAPGPGPAPGRRPPPFPSSTPEDSTRSLHKALALEGLRDWYLRNTLGHAASMELSLYQEPFPSQIQDLTLKEPSTELPAPGTLV